MIGRALVLLVLIAACSQGNPAAPRPRPLPVPTDPALAAARACQDAREVLDGARANVSAAGVRDVAKQARQLADAAADHDARWVQLDTAMRGLEQSLQINDGQLAGTSTVLLIQTCATAGVSLVAGSDDGVPRVDAP